MANFSYFGTTHEFVVFLQSALIAGYTIQVNNDRADPVPLFCTSSDDIARLVEAKQFVFLLSRADITRYPVSMMPFTRDGATLWAARPRHGGPVIEVYYWAPFEKDGKRTIPCWLLSYHGTIINPATKEFEAAGDAIKKHLKK